jgi:hypothetical protein
MKMMSQVKVRSSITVHILLVELGELSIESYTLKLTMGFQQQLATYLLFGQSTKQPHFPNT